jgi:hypothetical protein
LLSLSQTWCKFDVVPTPEARCAVRNPVHAATLHKDGAFTSCDSSGCLQNWDDQAHVVPDGKANEWNAFHCLVEQKGVTCTVIGGRARLCDQRVRCHARVAVVGSFRPAPSL